MVIIDKFETVEVDPFLSVRNQKCMRNGAKGVTYMFIYGIVCRGYSTF